MATVCSHVVGAIYGQKYSTLQCLQSHFWRLLLSKICNCDVCVSEKVCLLMVPALEVCNIDRGGGGGGGYDFEIHPCCAIFDLFLCLNLSIFFFKCSIPLSPVFFISAFSISNLFVCAYCIFLFGILEFFLFSPFSPISQLMYLFSFSFSLSLSFSICLISSTLLLSDVKINDGNVILSRFALFHFPSLSLRSKALRSDTGSLLGNWDAQCDYTVCRPRS